MRCAGSEKAGLNGATTRAEGSRARRRWRRARCAWHAGLCDCLLVERGKQHRDRLHRSVACLADRLGRGLSTRWRQMRVRRGVVRFPESSSGSAISRSHPSDPMPALGRGRSLRVDALAYRNGIELGVRRLLLVEVGGQEAHDLVVAEFFGPCDQSSVAAHLVVFDRL